MGVDKGKVIRGFLVVLASAFIIIAGAHVLRGNALADVVVESLAWAIVSAGIFTAARVYRLRKGQYCAVCGDAPPIVPPDADVRR
jgi:hypothetical protein